MTRDEHMKWCKERALRYLDENDCQNAIASMLSDLSKHEETRGIGEKLAMLGIMAIRQGPREVRKFIEGFN